MIRKTQNEIITDYKILGGIFNKIQLVNPIYQKKYEILESDIKMSDINCYQEFNSGKTCQTCIALRAFKEKGSFIKLREINKKTFLTIAIPIQVDDSILVIELAVDVSKQNLLHANSAFILNHPVIRKAITNLEQTTIHDNLTDLYNRKYIYETLTNDIIDALKKKSNLAVIMTDIDFFKKINDTYGHVNGDNILKMFANILKENIRETDWIARYGGDEFLICLKGVNQKMAYNIVETLRQIIEKEVFKIDNQFISISASFGIYNMNNKYIDSDELIKKADENLYKAKKAGRNKSFGMDWGYF